MWQAAIRMLYDFFYDTFDGKTTILYLLYTKGVH